MFRFKIHIPAHAWNFYLTRSIKWLVIVSRPSRMRLRTRSYIMRRNRRVHAGYRICFFSLLWTRIRGTLAQAGTHAIVRRTGAGAGVLHFLAVRAALLQDILHFACSVLPVCVEHPFGCRPSASRVCSLCWLYSWRQIHVDTVDPGLFPVDSNAPF